MSTIPELTMIIYIPASGDHAGCEATCLFGIVVAAQEKGWNGCHHRGDSVPVPPHPRNFHDIPSLQSQSFKLSKILTMERSVDS